MIQKLKTLIMSLAAMFIFAAPLATVAVPVSVHAQQITEGVCNGASKAATGTGQSCDQFAGEQDTKTQSAINKVINLLSIIVGVVAVVMIIVGGFRYITSGGASEKVTGAKNTILYGIIGLVIVALAQVIVQFVLSKTTTL